MLSSGPTCSGKAGRSREGAFLFRQSSEKIALFLAAKWKKFSCMFPAALFDAHRRSLAAGQENFSHLTA